MRRLRQKENPLRTVSARAVPNVCKLIPDSNVRSVQLPQLTHISPSTKVSLSNSRIHGTVNRSQPVATANEQSSEKVEVFRAVSKSLRNKIVFSSASKPFPLGSTSTGTASGNGGTIANVDVSVIKPNKPTTASKFDDNFREQIYAANALLRIEENEKFARFKQEQLSFGVGAWDLDYDSDSGSVFETPKWIVDQCKYYTAASDNQRRRRKDKKLTKPESACAITTASNVGRAGGAAVPRGNSMSRGVSGAV